jgi:(p)ppGpp synthase/HD superfamily hydrolase
MRHDGQKRKASSLPYLTHLVHTARILEPYGEDAVIAGLLHDVLEDTCHSPDEVSRLESEIGARFGERVLAAVRSVSETKIGEGGEKIPWKRRKESYIAHLEHAPELALMVSSADKIHNLATLVMELDRDRPATWSRFKASPEESFWFYEQVQAVVARRLGPTHGLASELSAWVDSLRDRMR